METAWRPPLNATTPCCSRRHGSLIPTGDALSGASAVASEGPQPPQASSLTREASSGLHVLGGGAVMLRGLRVRMAAATGRVDRAQAHAVTGRIEYTGPVLRLVQALAELPHGGQVRR